MPRLQNPYIQFHDAEGKPYDGGRLFFYESGTNTPKTVYADNLETTPVERPITLNANGSTPNVFYSGSARMVLIDKYGQQVFDRDPVGGESQLGNFSTWGPGIIYSVNDIVRAVNGQYYRSLQNANQSNDPTASAGNNAFWENVRFLGIYNAARTYTTGDVVQSTDGRMWRGVTATNLNNNPVTDSGTNWLPVVNILDYPVYTTHVILTGGGNLTANRVNEIRDGSTYTLPEAVSVSAGKWIDVYLPERYRASEPVVQRAGADTITDSTGTDTSITYNLTSWGLLRLVSDGVSNWSI